MHQPASPTGLTRPDGPRRTAAGPRPEGGHSGRPHSGCGVGTFAEGGSPPLPPPPHHHRPTAGLPAGTTPPALPTHAHVYARKLTKRPLAAKPRVLRPARAASRRRARGGVGAEDRQRPPPPPMHAPSLPPSPSPFGPFPSASKPARGGGLPFAASHLGPPSKKGPSPTSFPGQIPPVPPSFLSLPPSLSHPLYRNLPTHPFPRARARRGRAGGKPQVQRTHTFAPACSSPPRAPYSAYASLRQSAAVTPPFVP